MKTQDIYKYLSIFLIIVIVLIVIFGCRCKTEGFESSAEADNAKASEDKEKEEDKSESKDKFEDKSEPKEKSTKLATKPQDSDNNVPLSTKELELFDKLIKDEFDPKEIQSLMKEGFLTEELLNKFMKELKNKEPKHKDKPEVEAFCGGGNYAAWN